MNRHRVARVAVLAGLAASATPAAEGKFKASLAVDPARPAVGQPVRITMRTDGVLPGRRAPRLFAVGPWRQRSGQRVLDVRLVRIGARAAATSLRFPYAGRWLIEAWSVAGVTFTRREVRVAPR